MKTLLIENGDFVIGPGGFVSVDGPMKVKQDLAVAVREPYGSDRFHPRWGSLLHEYVGMAADDEMDLRVRAEITRLIQNYQFSQGQILERDTMRGRRSRFSTGELVDALQSIEVRQEFDRYHVRVTLRTLGRQEISLVRTVA